MLTLSGALPTTAAEAFLVSASEIATPVHGTVPDVRAVEAWATTIIPTAVEELGSQTPPATRQHFFATIAPHADIHLPDTVIWALDWPSRPNTEFAVTKTPNGITAHRIPLTREWLVKVPGVLVERVGVSADEAKYRADAIISYQDGAFHLEWLNLKAS